MVDDRTPLLEVRAAGQDEPIGAQDCDGCDPGASARRRSCAAVGSATASSMSADRLARLNRSSDEAVRRAPAAALNVTAPTTPMMSARTIRLRHRRRRSPSETSQIAPIVC